MKPKKIANTINDCFSPSPEIRAAHILYSNGVTEEILHSYRNSQEIKMVNEAWLCSVRNALRDIERINREGKTK